MFSMGPLEILLIFALALILLGPKRLPEAARQLGRMLGEVRRTTDDLRRTLDQEVRDEEREKRLAEYRERQQAAQAARRATLAGTGEEPTVAVSTSGEEPTVAVPLAVLATEESTPAVPRPVAGGDAP